jgi:hypothetical protein
LIDRKEIKILRNKVNESVQLAEHALDRLSEAFISFEE